MGRPTRRSTATDTLALLAAQAATRRAYGVDWLHFETRFRQDETDSYCFNVQLADELGIELEIHVYIGRNATHQWGEARVRISSLDSSGSGDAQEELLYAEQHDGIMIAWNAVEHYRRRRAASYFSRMMPTEHPDFWASHTLECEGFAGTVDGFLDYLEHLTGVRFHPILHEGQWQLHPTTPAGWIRCAPLTDLTIETTQFLGDNVTSPAAAS